MPQFLHLAHIALPFWWIFQIWAQMCTTSARGHFSIQMQDLFPTTPQFFHLANLYYQVFFNSILGGFFNFGPKCAPQARAGPFFNPNARFISDNATIFAFGTLLLPNENTHCIPIALAKLGPACMETIHVKPIGGRGRNALCNAATHAKYQNHDIPSAYHLKISMTLIVRYNQTFFLPSRLLATWLHTGISMPNSLRSLIIADLKV